MSKRQTWQTHIEHEDGFISIVLETNVFGGKNMFDKMTIYSPKETSMLRERNSVCYKLNSANSYNSYKAYVDIITAQINSNHLLKGEKI